MDYLEDIAFAVLFRLLRDTRKVKKFRTALIKLRDILNALPLESSN